MNCILLLILEYRKRARIPRKLQYCAPKFVFIISLVVAGCCAQQDEFENFRDPKSDVVRWSWPVECVKDALSQSTTPYLATYYFYTESLSYLIIRNIDANSVTATLYILPDPGDLTKPCIISEQRSIELHTVSGKEWCQSMSAMREAAVSVGAEERLSPIRWQSIEWYTWDGASGGLETDLQFQSTMLYSDLFNSVHMYRHLLESSYGDRESLITDRMQREVDGVSRLSIAVTLFDIFAYIENDNK